MSDCLFCKMVDGEIQPDVLYEDEELLVFRDIAGQAPLHCLLIPKIHIASLNELDKEHSQLMGRLILVAREIAKQHGFTESGYRLVINCNEDGGQSVFHIHCHLLAGRPMKWPPG